MLPNSNTNLFFSHHARLGLEQPSTSSSTTCKRAERKTAAARPVGSGVSTGLFFVRAQDARAERQAEGAVQVIERRQLTVLAQRRL